MGGDLLNPEAYQFAHILSKWSYHTVEIKFYPGLSRNAIKLGKPFLYLIREFKDGPRHDAEKLELDLPRTNITTATGSNSSISLKEEERSLVNGDATESFRGQSVV